MADIYNFERWTPPDVKIITDNQCGIFIANSFEENANPDHVNYIAKYTGEIGSFADEVKRCLGYIYITYTGNFLLNSLNASTRKVVIFPDPNGMTYNTYEGSRKKIDITVENGRAVNLIAAFKRGGFDEEKFITEFINIPEYKEAVTPQFDWIDFKAKIKPVTTTIEVESKDALWWMIDKIKRKHKSFNPNPRHVANSIVMTLYYCSDNGPGSNVGVGFKKAYVKSFDGEAYDDPLIKERPSAIGLAHELIHAYYSVKGKQPSRPSYILDDLICIGLGPWINEAITENKIRAEWNFQAYHMVPETDKANRTRVGFRTSHAD